MLKIYSAVQTEPVSLSETKEYIRIDSGYMSSNITVSQCIAGQYHAITAGLTGTGVDISGYRAMVVLESYSNSASATLDCKIQESDDNVTYTDWSGGAFTQVTTANDTANQQIEYTGSKKYINVYATVAAAQANFAVSIQKEAPYSTEDTFISSLISAAREYCERYQGRALAQQTWELSLDKFPSEDYIELPYPPLQSVTSVKYIDYAGTSATMTASTSGYFVDTYKEPGLIKLSYGITWPSFTEYPSGAVKIIYVAGHTGTAPDTIPQTTKIAMLMLISHMYENRSPVITSMSKELEFAITNLLDAHKVYTL